MSSGAFGLSRSGEILTLKARVSLLVLYSNFIGVKWEKEAIVPRVRRGASTLSDRGVQLSTTGIFAGKMENIVLLSTTSEKSKIRKNKIQYFIVQHFPFFRQKLSVVLNCTHRQKRAYAKLPWNHLEHEDSI